VNAQALQEQLEKGATLTLENCESHFQGLYAMSSMLAKAFAARVYASLFVVYKPELPLGLHWDDRDQFICQIVGHKQWPVYKPVYPNPLFDSRRFSYKVPPSDLVEEITLGPGDALYLPRGWLHDPAAVEGPSVHIAFAIITPTAYDLLEWIRSELKTRYPEIRADLPLSLPASARATYAARLRELIMNSLTDESIEAHYERHTREIQPTRVSLRPFSAGNSATLQHCGANHTIVPGRESA
jgi:ribosomal protein L16 Arg81 hydroxylase